MDVFAAGKDEMGEGELPVKCGSKVLKRANGGKDEGKRPFYRSPQDHEENRSWGQSINRVKGGDKGGVQN